MIDDDPIIDQIYCVLHACDEIFMADDETYDDIYCVMKYL
jgi:hypothetical protein